MDTFGSCKKHGMVQELLVVAGMILDVLQNMNFVPSKADSDVEMRPAKD